VSGCLQRGAADSQRAAELQALVDRLEVRELINRYALGVDSLDRTLLETVFAVDAVADYVGTNFPLDAHLEGFDAIFGWLEESVGGRGNTVPWHFMSTHLVEVDGDSARLRAYQHNRHMSGIGLYTVDAERKASGWRIVRFRLEERILDEQMLERLKREEAPEDSGSEGARSGVR